MTVRFFLKPNHLGGFLALLMGVTSLRAADPAKPVSPEKAMAESLARQRQSVAATAESLKIQRRALRRQTVRWTSGAVSPMPSLPALPAVAESPMTAIAPVANCAALPEPELETVVAEAAHREQLEPELLRRVIRQESAARPCAVSAKGAMGLMQLMPSTAQDLGVTDAFDPRENVDAGARLLKQLLHLYGGNLPLALGAFNAGPGRVNQAGGIPDFPETVEYIQRILGGLP